MQSSYRITLAAVVTCLMIVSSHAYTIKVTNYTDQDTWIAVYRHDTTSEHLYRTSLTRHLHGNGKTVTLNGIHQNHDSARYELYTASSADALPPRLHKDALPHDVVILCNVGTAVLNFFIYNQAEPVDNQAEPVEQPVPAEVLSEEVPVQEAEFSVVDATSTTEDTQDGSEIVSA